MSEPQSCGFPPLYEGERITDIPRSGITKPTQTYFQRCIQKSSSIFFECEV